MRIDLPIIVLASASLLGQTCSALSAQADGPRSRRHVQTHTALVVEAAPAPDAAAAKAPNGPVPNAATTPAPKIYLNFINGQAESLERELGALPGLVAGRVTLFTEPNLGLYPKLWKGHWRHGGTPVEADLGRHLQEVRRDVARLIPDPAWDGFAVIDYESWWPFWDRGVKPAYKDRVRRLVRAEHPNVSREEVESIAASRWNESAKTFLLQTIDLCRELRPNAKWGFFGWPKVGFGRISADQERFIESQQFLIDHSDALYPEAYARRVTIDSDHGNRQEAPRGRYKQDLKQLIEWSRRLGGDKPIMAYATLRYNNVSKDVRIRRLTDEDLTTMLTKPLEAGADGIILWAAVGQARKAERVQTEIRDRVIPILGRLPGASPSGGGASPEVPPDEASAAHADHPVPPKRSRRRAGG